MRTDEGVASASIGTVKVRITRLDRRRGLGTFGIAAGVVALALMPLLLGPYRTLLATEVLIYALFAMSFNLLFGYTGLLSFGHAAYFAAGAYASAFTIVSLGQPLWAGVLAGLVGGALLAALLGVLCVRVNEIYFSLLTLAFGMLVYTVVFQAREVTGGSDGYQIFELGTLFGAPAGRPDAFYWLTLAAVVAGSLALLRVVRSPFGQTLRAIRANPERVLFFGVPVRRYQYRAFVIAGAGAGLAGSLIAPFLRVAAPEMAHWTTSAEVVLGTLLGGAGFFLGPAVGTGVLIWLESVVTGRTVYWPLVMGLILLGLVLFLPGGILGSLAKLTRRRVR